MWDRPSVSTDAALDLLFNSSGSTTSTARRGGRGVLSEADSARMNEVIASTSAALRRDGESVALLLRRAALLVALGEAALARRDYERVLQLEPSNREAGKYVDLAAYGIAFDPYEVLGVPRDAEAGVISVAFRRLAKQWHPDRWVGATRRRSSARRRRASSSSTWRRACSRTRRSGAGTTRARRPSPT